MTTSDNVDTPRRIRFDRFEASGALGDLGTFIPLLAGMVNRCGLQLGPALLSAGVMNLITGALFGIPMPVQPMKAIATVAIAEGLSESQILAAGIATGAIIMLLVLTGLIDWMSRAVPTSVVRGLQLALGLKLLTRGFEMIAGTQQLFGWDSVGLGILCAALVLLLYFSTRVPGALVVFGIGLIALLAGQPSLLHETQLGMSWSMPSLLNVDDWLVGLARGTVPQIPLTTLNSVIAVCALSNDMFPACPATPKRVALSVALMNLVCCPFGGMPMCHGAGGLASQYRFGARTGGSVVMLGVAKIALAVILGSSLLTWMQHYPQSVLGVLLLFGGLELALVCRDQNTRVSFFVMLITAGACMAVNTALGFAVGWIMAVLLLRGVFRIEPPPTNDPRAT
ncbi:MAG: putative sulfate/molybdate transporter [Phycisphaerae bacterium]